MLSRLNDLSEVFGWDYFEIDPFTAGVVTLGFIYGAYFTENFRGALKAIPETQTRAARSLGMPPIMAFNTVILPQMLRISFLPMSNQMVWAVLMTSLGVTVGMNYDLYGVTQDLNALTFRTFELFAIAAVIFYVITKLVKGKAKDVHPIMYIVSGLFLLKYVIDALQLAM